MNNADIIVIIAAITPVVGVIINNISNRKITTARVEQENIGGEMNINESWEKYGNQIRIDMQNMRTDFNLKISDMQKQIDARDKIVIQKDDQITNLTNRVAALEDILKINNITF